MTVRTLRPLAVALLLAVAGASGAARAEPLTIRIQTAVAPSHLTPLIPIAPPGLYRHYGKSYVVKPVMLAGSGPGMTALAAGAIDMAAQGAQSLTLTVTNAKLDVRAIAQQTSSGAPGYGTAGFWVLKDRIKTLDDLRGKVIGINARGSSGDSAVRLLFGERGWKEGTDWQFAELRFPNQLPAVLSQRIDAAFLVHPFSDMARKNPKLKRLFTLTDALGPTETLIYVAKADWIAKHRAALVDFLEDHMRLRAWLTSTDPKTHADVLALVAKLTKRPVKSYQGWLFTRKDNYRAPDLKIDVARLQKNIDDLHKLGVLKQTIDAAHYVDMSLAAEAWKRFKM